MRRLFSIAVLSVAIVGTGVAMAVEEPHPSTAPSTQSAAQSSSVKKKASPVKHRTAKPAKTSTRSKKTSQGGAPVTATEKSQTTGKSPASY